MLNQLTNCFITESFLFFVFGLYGFLEIKFIKSLRFSEVTLEILFSLNRLFKSEV